MAAMNPQKTPAVAHLYVYQGDDYAATVTVSNGDGTPADLSGYTAKAQIRRDVADVQPQVAAELSCTIDSPNIYLALTHDQTAALSGTLKWDLQLTETASGVITTILAGSVPDTQEVTRAGTVSRIDAAAGAPAARRMAG